MPAGQSARAMAADLQRQADELRRSAEYWTAGAVGEERVGTALAGAGPDVHVLHDRLLRPGETRTNLDHLVVCTAGVFLVDAKNWTGLVNASGDSLWQHWTAASGPRNVNKNLDLDQVAGMARTVAAKAGVEVNPVLCLASERSGAFGEATPVRGVTVVPVDGLVDWLRARPAVLATDRVRSLAVDLSCLFPPAVEAGLTLESMALGSAPREATPVSRPASHVRSRSAGRRRSASSGVARVLVGLMALVALIVFGPQLARGFGNTFASAFAPSTGSATNAGTAPAVHLTPHARLALEDWRIDAGLYEDNDEPSALPYVPDDGLGQWSDQCRGQRHVLRPYRHGLLAAPDHALAVDAVHFDRAARALLSACVHDRPVALHRARSAMTRDAARATARYEELLGIDPQTDPAVHVL